MLKIVTYPNKILEIEAEEVKFPLSIEDKKTALEMFEYVSSNEEAAGLAAPQIGKSKKICVISDENEQPILLINPKIVFYSQLEIPFVEGCLSFPGEFYEIVRPKNIKLEYYDINGKKRSVNARDWLARVIQHEVDHLNGILFINKGGKKITEEELAKRSENVTN